MAAPLYGHGHLAGILSLCRRRHNTEFGDRDIELATIFGGYISASLATLPRNAEAEPVLLTIRERQIALLAAQGATTPRSPASSESRETVKQALRRVYSKLDVSGRAEMATTLAKRGWL
jgi:DNA-binding CsgD family transcriptional regulator